MIGYVTLGTNDLARAAAFYDALAKELGTARTMENEQFIAGVSDSIIGTSWTLTPKGVHKTRQF